MRLHCGEIVVAVEWTVSVWYVVVVRCVASSTVVRANEENMGRAERKQKQR